VRAVRGVLGVLMVLGVLGLRPGAVGTPPAHPSPSLKLKEVVKRAERYVGDYGDKASIVVCTERYQQESSGSGGRQAHRTLVSDFALVHAAAIRGWLGFRDVIDVDGQRLSDREDRLARVLMGSEGRFDEAFRLSNESARYNIGAIQRNFNVPTTALFFFLPDNHDRFKFSAKSVAADGTWEIAFRETGSPTLIRSPDGTPVPSSGTIWVRPEDGTIVRTRLDIDAKAGRGALEFHSQGHVDVVYRHVDELNMWLPASMEEAFTATRQQIWDEVSGQAEYSDYRQFTTSARIK
jgi:hypothetical protein